MTATNLAKLAAGLNCALGLDDIPRGSRESLLPDCCCKAVMSWCSSRHLVQLLNLTDICALQHIRRFIHFTVIQLAEFRKVDFDSFRVHILFP